jgi:hypothetical protein
MGIFPYVIVLRDIPFKKKLWAQNGDFKFQRVHINFSGVNDLAEILHEIFELFHNFVLQILQEKFWKFQRGQ